MRSTAIAATTAMLVLVASAAAQQNLLTNPGFEEIAAENTQMPAGWNPHGGDTEQLARHLVDDAHSGERAVLIIDDYASEERVSEREAGSGIVQRVDDIQPGAYYKLTCWANCRERSRDNAAWLQLRFRPSNEMANTHLNSPVGQWQQFTAIAQAPEGTTHAEVYIKTLHMGSCRYLVDDFDLHVLTADPQDQRLALLPFGSEGIAPEQVHEPNLHTPIVTGGEPAAHIVTPDDKQWHDIGIRLAGEIEARTGAELDVPTSTGRDWGPLRSEQTTIAVGHLRNNFVVERLWLQRYQEVNARRPGPGEYILQTVPEPHDCPRGKNVLLIGASDLDGAERGTQRLLELLGQPQGDMAIDEWILEVSGAEHLSDEQRQQLVGRETSKFWLRDFHSAVRSYRDTGDPAWAERARFILRKINERYLQFAHDPDVLKYWPEPTAAGTHRIYWPEETSSDWIGTMWDFFEEVPVLTEEDRWRGANSMLNALHDLPRHVSAYGMFADPETTWPVVFNHSTFPLIGMYYLARHFDRFYPDVDTSRIDDYLDRCANCFNNQKLSFKPTEDATGYFSIVPRHTINYTLSEGDYSYFDDGHVRMLADYTVGICDNTGDPGNFGDSGYGHGTYTRNLDWALWYYDDPRLQWWLERAEREDWRNPFTAALQSEPWEEIAGVTPFPLTQAIYDWTTETPAYGPALMPPNVPREKCFDKIAFRESLQPDAQYFLLDGYARGGHLHYDGNAITKFFADGEDWLMDGDYLVRNTTDHTMLSVVRDGRCEEVEPPCAALEHLADSPEMAMTQTAVYGYNGIDWRRNIFWLKGGPVVLLDHCTAAEPGDYSLECIFKMIDEGEISGDGLRVFSLTRQAAVTRGLTVVEEPAAGVGAAVRFEGRESELSFPLAIPEGEYRANVIGLGLDSGTDSFYLSVDEGDPVAIHLPLGQFGRPYDSGVNPKSGPMPKIAVPSDGAHLVRIWPREAPGVLLDRVEFVSGEGEVVAAMEAEDAREVETAEVVRPPDRAFHLRNCGHSRLVQSTRINHARIPIRYVHHTFGGKLAAGDVIGNLALFFSTRGDREDNWDIQRVDEGTAVVLEAGRPRAVVSISPGGLLDTDAAMAWIGRRQVVLCDASHLAEAARADGQIDLRIDLSSGEIWACADEPTRVTVAGGEQLDVGQEGHWEVSLPEGATTQWRRAARSVLQGAAARAQFGPGGESPVEPPEGLQRAWEVPAAVHEEQPQPAIEMEVHDLDGDGADEVLAVRGRYLTAIATDGSVRWQFDGTDELYACSAYDIDGDGALEAFCGGKSKILYVLDTDGTLLREHPIETYWRVSRTTIHEPRLDDVLVRDFDGDGQWEAAMGTVDGFTQVINSDFSQRWIFGETNHGTTELQAMDVNGDGVEELAVGNRYGKLFVLSVEDGSRMGYRGSELGDVQMRVADLDRDGIYEMLNGSATGVFKCGQVGSREVLWEFSNFGYAWRDIKVADLAGGEDLQVACCSDTGYVYLLDAAGEQIASRNLHSAVLNLALVPGGERPLIAAGCLSGMVYLLDGELDEVGRFPAGSQVNWVAAANAPDGPTIAAALQDGRVVGLRP